jgi:hypothetical protein
MSCSAGVIKTCLLIAKVSLSCELLQDVCWISTLGLYALWSKDLSNGKTQSM